MNQLNRSILYRSSHWLHRAWLAIRPGRRAWTGAALGLPVIALLFLLPAVAADFGGTDLFGLILGLLASSLVGAVVALGGWPLKRLLFVQPDRCVAAAAGALATIWLALIATNLKVPAVLLAAGAVASLLGTTVWVLARGGWKQTTRGQRLVIAAGLTLGLAGPWAAATG
jgi:hypothetical protein